MKVRTGTAKFIRAVCIITAVVLSVGLFNGCGNNNAADGKKTVLTVGSWPPNEGAAKEKWDERKQRFEEANQDISINPDTWGFELKTFYAKAAGGNLPTLYNTHVTEMSQIISSGYAADITDALKKHNVYDKMNKDILKLISKDGKVYAYPYESYALGLGCNIDLMKKAGLVDEDETPKQPKNWDEVLEFAVKIKEATGKPGFVFPTSGNNGGWLFTALAWSFGTEFMKQGDDGKWTATFDSPEAAAALQWIKDLKWKYDVLPANTLIDGTEYYKVFGTGDAGMFIAAGDLTYRLPKYGTPKESIGMLAMPAGPKRHVTLLGGNITVVSDKATEKEIDAAVRWMKSAYTPDITDEFKLNADKEMQTRITNDELVTIKSMVVWNQEAQTTQYQNELIEKYANGNKNHVKPYNEFIADLGDCQLQAEEPMCAQALYGVLDSCIQEVLTYENADCAEVLRKANSDFQKDYLDNVDY